MNPKKRKSFFSHFANRIARACGQPAAFAIAVSVILIWALTGPIFHFSDTWQLIINTSTTIVTFLMVFLIQSTQNRESEAMQLKLDELIRAIKGAQNTLLNLEELDEEELDAIKAEYLKLAEIAKKEIQSRKNDATEEDENNETNTDQTSLAE